MKMIATLSGPGGPDRVRLLAQHALFRDLPDKLSLEDEHTEVSLDWAERLVRVERGGLARWDPPNKRQVSFHPRSDQLVSFSFLAENSTTDEALAFLEPLPFEICAFGATFFHEWIAADYRRWSFSRSHIDHGWGCAFRGAGHDRLVSRRWLEFGPWRVLRRPDDTTFIQFHDLAITDPAEAYEQAKVGHERMGLSNSGGFIQQIEPWMLADGGRGLYDPKERLLEVIVAPEVPVPQSKMLNSCALRLHHRLTKPAVDPVDRIAYVFLDLDEARAHLHELWLRELECWVIDGDGRRRLDLDYHPVPDPPAWVRRLNGR